MILDHPKEDHSEQESKHSVIGGILDLLKKSSKARETYKWSITLSILDLLIIFSEVIVASKRGPPARIEKTGYVVKTRPIEKFL